MSTARPFHHLLVDESDGQLARPSPNVFGQANMDYKQLDHCYNLLCRLYPSLFGKANTMKLDGYLEELVGSRVAFRLARTLLEHKDRVFTIRGLAGLAQASISEAAEAVRRLKKLGVIKVQPEGRSHMLSLNEKSYVLNKILKPMIEAEQETFDSLVSTLKNHLNSKKTISAVIYGGVLGDRDEDGIQLLIISADHLFIDRTVPRLEQEVSLVFNTRVSVLIIRRPESMLQGNRTLQKVLHYRYWPIAGKDPRRLYEGK